MANIVLAAQTITGNGTNNTSTVAKASVTFVTGETVIAVVGNGSTQSASGVADGTNTYTAISGATVTHTANLYKLTGFISPNVTGGTYTVTGTISANTTNPSILIARFSNAATAQSEPGSGNYQGAVSSTAADGIVTGNATLANQPAMLYSIMYGGGSCSNGSNLTFDQFGTSLGSASGFNATWNSAYARVTSTGSKQGLWTNSNSADSIATMLMMVDELVASTVKSRALLLGVGR